MGKIRVIALFPFIFFVSMYVMGQLANITSFVGTVTDSSGAVIANATISAVDVGTQRTYRVVTNSQGSFVVPFVQAGTYSVSATANGFKTQVKTGLVVLNDQTVRVAFELAVGQASQTVTVTGVAPAISTDTPDVAETLTTQQITNLPLNGRDALMLATTTPGVIQGFKQNTVGAPGEDFIGAGGREVQNDLTLDGISIMSNLVTKSNFHPSIDAVREVQVQTGTFSAQYGGYMGVHINVVTKSGTNQLHGSVFEFIRNNALDARGFFEDPSKPKTPFRRNQFGAELDGPMVIPKLYDGRNRTFFMGSYEGVRQVQTSSSLGTVFTPLMRQGNFSELSKPITDPLLPGDPVLAGNVIPKGDIAPQAIQLLQFMPSPNIPGSGITNNFTTSTANNDSWNQILFRVDENLSQNANVFFRFGHLSDNAFVGSTDNYSATFQPDIEYNWVVGYTQVFNSNTVNDFRFGRQSDSTDTSSQFFGNAKLQALAANLGIPGGFQPTPQNPGLPVIAITGWSGLSTPPHTAKPEHTWQANDQFSYTHGAHTIIAGFELYKMWMSREAVNNPLGAFSFSGGFSGSAASDYMLGIPLTVSSPEALVNGEFGQWRNGLFVLDKWEATHKLSLNIGVRYEIPSAVKSLNGYATQLNADQTKLIPEDAPHPGSILVNPIWTAVAPRIGFAYRFANHWVFRGGAGLYYNPNHFNDFTLLDLNPPFAPTFNYQNTDPKNITVTFADPMPSSATAPAPPTNVITLSQNLKLERMNQWSAGLERSLWRNAGLDLEYLGKYSYHLDRSFYNNTPLPGPGPIQPRRPNQLWGQIRTMSNDESSNYNGLSVILTQRMYRNLTLLASYTWSHALDESSDSNNGQVMDPYHPELDYGNANWDIRHRFVIDYTYALPSLKNYRNPFVQYALGGWQVNGITTAQTGFPFTVTTPGDIANHGIGGQRPNIVGKISYNCGGIGHLNHCISPAAFALPARYTYGNAGRNILTGPGLVNFDFSLFKDIPIRDRLIFQFRAAFFNLFNTPSFSAPSATFGTASFGDIGSTSNDSREVQLAGRLFF